MITEPKLIYHFTDYSDFEFICLENEGLAFPELEKIMYDYVLNQPEKSIEFKECWIHHEQSGEETLRTIQITFQDDNINKVVRLWGVKSLMHGTVLKMTIDFIDPDTHEVEYEAELAVE